MKLLPLVRRVWPSHLFMGYIIISINVMICTYIDIRYNRLLWKIMHLLSVNGIDVIYVILGQINHSQEYDNLHRQISRCAKELIHEKIIHYMICDKKHVDGYVEGCFLCNHVIAYRYIRG